MNRRYESPVRDQRAAKTRLALLEACEALLVEGPVEEVTLPAVARRAGVTKPTAYSHFPDQDALMAGLLQHVRGRIGMEHDALGSIPPSKLPAAVRDNYRRYEASAEVLRRVMDSPSYERVRRAQSVDRAAVVLPTWKGVARERDLREWLGAVYLLVTPASWRWLRDTWGLDADGAARSAAWAMEALVTTLEAKRAHKEKDHEDSSRHDPGPRPRARRARPR